MFASLSGFQWCVALFCALSVGVSKTGLPGIGILGIPLMAMIMPAKASTGIILPMLIFGDIAAVSYYHRHAVWSHLWRLLPWSFAGIVIGYLIMERITDAQLTRVIGVIVLVMLALNALRERLTSDSAHIPTQWYFAAFLGLTAGVTTMMANAAGPIAMIYLLAMRLPKNEFIGTGAWFFFVVNCVKVPFSLKLGLITADSFRFNLILFVAVAAGAALGILLVKRMPQRAFNIAVQALAVVAAIKMLF